MIKAVCWGVLVLILLAAVILALYIAGMTLYFHYQLKDGRIKESTQRSREEQIQAIREMQARKEEKRQKRRQRKSEANRR